MKPWLLFLMPALSSVAVSSHAARGRYPIGLSDRAVNCIPADNTAAIPAGTDSGVSVLRNTTWHHVKMPPVKALERVAPPEAAAAAGGGAKSGGIYIGRAAGNGSAAIPPALYIFVIGRSIANPTALTSQPIIGAAGGCCPCRQPAEQARRQWYFRGLSDRAVYLVLSETGLL